MRLEQDLISCFYQDWIDSLDWNKADEWTGVLTQWKIETKSGGLKGAGDCETVVPLTLCTVYNSGHMVPTDQPEVAYNLMKTFIAGEIQCVPMLSGLYCQLHIT